MGLKIIHISDTHNKHNQLLHLESGDVIVHSGDATGTGYLYEVSDFLKWFGSLNYKYKIFVAGNHDFLFEEDPILAKQLCDDNGVIWLQDEAIVIDGYKFYGTADQPEFFNWAFNKNHDQLVRSYSVIPEDTQVLITHCPPKNILDYTISHYNPNGVNVGCQELAFELYKLKNLKAHLFGHIHYSNGQKLLDGVVYSNAAICDERYSPSQKENIIELL